MNVLGFRKIHIVLCMTFLSLATSAVNGQDVDSLIDNGHCDLALPILKEKYEENTQNLFSYSKYLKCLFALNEKREARKLIENFSRNSKFSMVQWDQIAYSIVFEQDESILSSRPFLSNTFEVTAATNRWTYLGLNELSKVALERSSASLNNKNFYGDKLIDAYESTEEVDKALEIYIGQLSNPRIATKDVEEKILNLLSTEEKLQKAKKYLLAEAAKNPRNSSLSKLLLWIYESKNDWAESLDIAMQLEKEYDANGTYANALMTDALAVDRFDVVEDALARMDKMYEGSETADINFLNRIYFYKNFEPQKLTKEYLDKILPKYDAIILEGDYWNTDYIFDYTDIHYHSLGQRDEMIAFLEENLEEHAFTGNQRPLVELKIGDYFAQDGDRWDALLYYSRVEKSQKNEMLGEEARYKNAKLSYYFGDFEWAKDQLGILKTATQEYIANDALELWLRIIDNTPSDSNFVPMQTLAKAEYFIWQEEYDSANVLLNTISLISQPDDPIMADVYLMSAHLAHLTGDSNAERRNLERIIRDYSDDILADDAYYELAVLDITEGKKEDARLLLEQFLIKFDNSPLLIEVRNMMRTYFPDS